MVDRESDFWPQGAGAEMEANCTRGQLRTGFNRAEMLKVQKEIDCIKKVSSSAAKHKRAVSKAVEAQRKLQGDGIGELAPDFGKQEMPYVRKTDSLFTKEYLTKPVPVRKVEPGTVPPYNPLNKDVILVPHTAKTKKRPYHKEETVTTQEMKKPHVQSTGVIPVRSTGSAKELNVRLQGKPTTVKDQTAITAIQQANVTSSKRSSTITVATSDLAKASEMDTSQQQPPAVIKTPEIPDATESPPDLKRKPAILGQVDTIAPVKFSARAEVEVPKKKVIKLKKKSAKKTPSSWDDSEYDDRSFISDEMDLSLSRPSGSPVRDRYGRSTSQLSKASSVTSQKSTTQLLEEAKDIVSSDSLSLLK